MACIQLCQIDVRPGRKKSNRIAEEKLKIHQIVVFQLATKLAILAENPLKGVNLRFTTARPDTEPAAGGAAGSRAG